MQFMAVQFGVKLASEKEADDFAAYLNNLVNRSTVFDTSRTTLPGIGTGYYAQVMTVHSFRHTIDPRPKLRNSSIPVLVMKGQYDNQLWGFTHEYLELFPHAGLVVFPDAGHCIFCDQPVAYLAAMSSFLKKGE
jgi:proline iminopeptidase